MLLICVTHCESGRASVKVVCQGVALTAGCSGGMGLTGGFADVGGLYDCLYGIYSGQADDSILDKYDEIRREKYQNVIDPISSGNLRRLWDPSSIEDDKFIKMIKRAETDKDFAREMQQVCSFHTQAKFAADFLSAGSESCHARLYAVLSLSSARRMTRQLTAVRASRTGISGRRKLRSQRLLGLTVHSRTYQRTISCARTH